LFKVVVFAGLNSFYENGPVASKKANCANP